MTAKYRNITKPLIKFPAAISLLCMIIGLGATPYAYSAPAPTFKGKVVLYKCVDPSGKVAFQNTSDCPPGSTVSTPNVKEQMKKPESKVANVGSAGTGVQAVQGQGRKDMPEYMKVPNPEGLPEGALRRAWETQQIKKRINDGSATKEDKSRAELDKEMIAWCAQPTADSFETDSKRGGTLVRMQTERFNYCKALRLFN